MSGLQIALQASFSIQEGPGRDTNAAEPKCDESFLFSVDHIKRILRKEGGTVL